MKKIVCFIFFVLLSLNVEAMVIHGQLDDGFMLGEGESQHQFLLGLDAMLFNQLHGAYQQLNIFSFPFYNGVYQIKGATILSGSPLMLLPMATFGYIARWHVLKNFEINFNVFSSTPSPGQCVIMSNAINWFKNDRNSPFYSTYHDDNNYPYNIHFYSIDTIFFMNLWGVPTSVGIGFKKNIREDENSSFSYKFNLGLDYTGDAHGGISIKNSFLFARKLPQSILSFNPFINAALKIGVAASYQGAWIVAEPGFEIVSKIISKDGFCFTSTFMIGYEMDFVIMPNPYFYVISEAEYFYYAGRIVVSSSFGLGRSGLPKKKKSKEGSI